MSEEKYSIGPVSHSDLKKIEEVFKARNIAFEVVTDSSDLNTEDPERQSNLKWTPVMKNRYGQTDHSRRESLYHRRFLYVSFNKEDVLKVKEDIERWALVINESHQEDQSHLLEGEDYLCTECDYHAREPGFCREHGLKLLSFSEWRKVREEPSPLRQFLNRIYHRLIIVTCVLIVITAILFLVGAVTGVDYVEYIFIRMRRNY
jgi:hypothetical protein